MHKYIESLTNMGLSEKEARVYVALLEFEQASAYAIAEKAKIKRPTTYVILDELMKKGLVTKIPNAKKRSFSAKSPEAFFKEQEVKMQRSKHILPELMSLAGENERKVKVLYYEGLKGMGDAIDYGTERMQNKELVGFYSTAHKIAPELLKLYDAWDNTLDKNKIHVRGFTPDHASSKEMVERDIQNGHDIHIVPYSEYSSNISIDAGETFVRIMMNTDLQAVIIENPQVAKTLREIFEMAWKKR